MKTRLLPLLALLLGAMATHAQPLLLRCETNKTVECGSAWDFDPPLGYINACPPTELATVTVLSTVTNGPCPLIMTRTWKVTDDCGNMATCSQSVTNLDTRAPTITCAPDQTVECGTPWTFPVPTAFDHCTATADLVFSVVSTVTNFSACPTIFTATRIWQVADLCTNTATCTQSVAVVDTKPPALSCQCLQDPSLTVTACSNAIPDVCLLVNNCVIEDCGPLTCTQSPPAGTIVLPGEHPITVTVTDCASNSAMCVVKFTVIEPQGGCTNPCPEGIRVWNTGQGGPTGNLALAPGTTDLNFALVGIPPGGCAGPAQVIGPGGFPSPPWLPNSGESQWIGPAFNVSPCQVGTYQYQLRFDLPCVTDARIDGRIAADNSATVVLNGGPVALGPVAFSAWTPVSITSGFLTGPNVLDVYVTNFSAWTGLRAELTNSFIATNTSPCCCPPPQITCPLPTSVPCGTPITFNPPPAFDLCCGTNATVTALGTTTNGTCPQFVHRVWQAIDCRGQTAICTQTVAIVDSAPPMFCVGSTAENLVPNPGFEINTGCPSDFSGQIVLAVPWTGANAGTADYYHTCALNPNLDVPNNLPGSQIPNGGNAYAGIHTAFTTESSVPPDYREYVQAPLSAVLVAGRIYSVSFYVSLSDTSEKAVDNIGAYLSDTAVSSTTSNALLFTPQVRNPAGSFLSNKTGWTLIQGEFIASGDEMFVTIGNFYDDASTPIMALSGDRDWAYYYIDDVRVAEVCCDPATVECSAFASISPPSAIDACAGTNVTVTLLTDTVSGPPCARLHSLVWQAADPCGNTTTCTQRVTVVDATPPLISCPPNITRNICSNSVNVFYLATATDACSAPVAVSCIPPSGSLFSVGTATVNCTATDACGNSSSCSFTVTVVNNAFWQILPKGVSDCYAWGVVEPAVPGAMLLAANPPPTTAPWKNFDDSLINRRVGVTWNFPATWNIIGATFHTRVRPNCDWYVESPDDRINLGLTGTSWAWNRYFGAFAGEPGIVLPANPWCSVTGPGCPYLLNLNLAALPVASGGTANLLPQMNSADRLDLFIQDATTVDFARLRVQRCPPLVLGGISVELTNAQLIVAPGVWRLAFVNPELPLRADFSLGQADGFRLPIGPLALADYQGAAIEFGGADPGRTFPVSYVFPRLALGTDEQGAGEVRLNGLPPGVPVIELAVLVDGAVVQSNSVPATEGMLLATFEAASPLVELTLANGNELLATVIEQGARVTLRVRLSGWVGSFPTCRVRAQNVPELAVQQPSLQLKKGCSPCPPPQAQGVFCFITSGGVGEISGAQAVISPLDSAGDEPVGMTASFPPTNELRAAIQASFGEFAPTPSNASLTLTLVGEQDDFVGLNFAHTGSDWSVSARAGKAPLSLASVHVFHNGSNIAAVANPARVEVAEAPANFWASSRWQEVMGGEFCLRFPYAGPVIVRVNGAAYVADEFVLMTANPGQSPQAVGRLKIEATGAEALSLADLELGPITYRMEPPVLEGDDLVVRGSTLGAVMESAPTVRGPWTTALSESGETRVKITNAPQMYYRLKGR